MRTVRISLVGMVALALLGGFSGVAVAQDVAETPVYVTGPEICTTVQEACEVVDGVERCGGFLDGDCLVAQGCQFWGGSDILDGPESGWDCALADVEDPLPDSVNPGLLYCDSLGTGAYDPGTGARYTWHHVYCPSEHEPPPLRPPSVTE